MIRSRGSTSQSRLLWAGIRRRRRGKRFEYFQDSGRKIKDPEVLDRIAQLRIPPAWEEGWWRGLRGENDSYGLATMRKEHVTVARSGAVALAVSGEASQSTNARKRA